MNAYNQRSKEISRLGGKKSLCDFWEPYLGSDSCFAESTDKSFKEFIKAERLIVNYLKAKYSKPQEKIAKIMKTNKLYFQFNKVNCHLWDFQAAGATELLGNMKSCISNEYAKRAKIMLNPRTGYMDYVGEVEPGKKI